MSCQRVISRTSYSNYEIVIVQVGERDKVAEAGTDFRVCTAFPRCGE